MNILVLAPSLRTIACSYFADQSRQALRQASIHGPFSEATAISQLLTQLTADARAMGGKTDLISIIVPYGGERFAGPVLAGSQTLDDLEALAQQAPLHLPVCRLLLQEIRGAFPHLPVAMSFQTAFFVGLPPREQFYGLEASSHPRLRRFGYHGLFHAAACRHAAHLCQEHLQGPARVLSICLDKRPELAAVAGRRPLMVTSGATPMEGLPGETACGELDPSIVLALSSRLHLGPEQINQMLTRDSGIAALAGSAVNLDSVLSPTSSHRLARDLLRYRILLACGMGIAALGGLDAIVFSGRYAQAGRTLGPYLLGKLAYACPAARKAAQEIVSVDLHRLAADEAHLVAVRQPDQLAMKSTGTAAL